MSKSDERMEIAIVEGLHFHLVCKVDRVNSSGMFVFTQGKKWAIWDLGKQAPTRNKTFGPDNFWISTFANYFNGFSLLTIFNFFLLFFILCCSQQHCISKKKKKKNRVDWWVYWDVSSCEISAKWTDAVARSICKYKKNPQYLYLYPSGKDNWHSSVLEHLIRHSWTLSWLSQ